MTPLSQQIRSAPKAKKLTQKALGEKMGWPQSHISHMESGKVDIRLSSLMDLARFLDLELMLVPRPLTPLVDAILSGNSSQSPAWTVDGEDEG